ncbi:hypothetical protein [Phytohabitans rumicis]|uniref:hypothetical protein n=1 Tax=Phytohabitans rumicis TaxID=1076125 RepID=UPI0015636FE0|nr:hypothetical protein [Phytohabitans rumicis]
MSAGAAALAASGLFGGLEQVRKPEIPPATLNELNKGEPWNVTVTGGRLVGELPGLSLQDDANHWVAVVATVEVTAPESRNDMREIVDISGVDGLLHPDEPDRILVVRDATPVDYLNPGMPEKLAFLWEQSGSVPVPTEMRVTIYQKTYRLDTLGRSMEWLDLEPRAELTVPIEDRREA